MTDKLKAVRLAPHLALTHELTEGAANGRNVSLLMKNKEDLTEEQKELLKSLSGKQEPTSSDVIKEDVAKATDNLENGEEMADNQVNQDKQELVKALADLTKAKKDLVKANEIIETLQKSVAAFEQAEVEAEASRRLEIVKGVQQDEEKAQELVKSLEALDSDAFNTVIKAMQEKVEAVESSDLFKQTSVTKSDSKESTLAEMLKAKHQVQA